jgi:hypothetical protein
MVVLAVTAITARKILVVDGCKDGATLKACKKCAADQKQKNDGNPSTVPTLIRNGSVGGGGNCC